MITGSSSYYIELPRNFSFISRLPSRFMLGVISEKNITPKGIWYEVMIAGHKLNILSRRKLTEGKNYLVRKKGGIYLEVVDEKSINEKNSIKEKPEPFKMPKTDRSATEKITSRSLISFEDIVSDFNFIDFLTSMAVLSMNEEESLSIRNTSGTIRFSIRPIILDHLDGVFMKDTDGYRLYLSSTEKGQSHLLKHMKSLTALLEDLNIKSIHVVSKSRLDSLKSRIDIEI